MNKDQLIMQIVEDKEFLNVLYFSNKFLRKFFPDRDDFDQICYIKVIELINKKFETIRQETFKSYIYVCLYYMMIVEIQKMQRDCRIISFKTSKLVDYEAVSKNRDLDVLICLNKKLNKLTEKQSLLFKEVFYDDLCISETSLAKKTSRQNANICYNNTMNQFKKGLY